MKKQKPILQICFIFLSAASLLLFWLVPFLGQKDVSETENRSLAKLPAFSADACTLLVFPTRQPLSEPN